MNILLNVKKFWASSIHRQLSIGVILTHAILMSIFVFDLVEQEKSFLLKQSERTATSLSKVIAISGTSWFLSNDLIGLEEIIAAQKELKVLNYAMFIDKSNKILAYTDRTKVGQYLSDNISLKLLNAEAKTQILFKNDINLDVVSPIFSNKMHVGWVRVNINRKLIANNINLAKLRGFSYSLIAILVGILFAHYMAKGLTASIRQLIKISKEVEDGNRLVTYDVERSDELGILSNSLNATLKVLSNKENQLLSHKETLEKEVFQRTNELREANIQLNKYNKKIQSDKVELEKSYGKLLKYKEKLVEQEKFSHLGKLTADIAHELNTPLSVAITSNSIVEHETENIIKLINQTHLKKQHLVSSLATIQNAYDLSNRNLLRCTSLINNFKKISSDQFLEDIKDVAILLYIQDVVDTLAVILKKENIHCLVQGCNPTIKIDPGLISQIITNLVSNSIIHAFENIEDKKIIITVTEQEQWIICQYQDNGIGMLVDSKRPVITT